MGHGFCLDAKNGKKIWFRDLLSEENATKPIWGFRVPLKYMTKSFFCMWELGLRAVFWLSIWIPDGPSGGLDPMKKPVMPLLCPLRVEEGRN